MHRLFVAIRPPRPMREQLLRIMGGVPNARWQDEDQLHLTLRFIGAVDRHRAEDLAVALASLHFPAFEVRLSGIGCFERRGRGALWAGLSPVDDLRALHRKVDQACARTGLPRETRAFHPHVTIARTSRETGPLEPFMQRWGGLTGPAYAIEEMRLYESRLGSEGASYTTVARYPLRPVMPAQAPS